MKWDCFGMLTGLTAAKLSSECFTMSHRHLSLPQPSDPLLCPATHGPGLTPPGWIEVLLRRAFQSSKNCWWIIWIKINSLEKEEKN